MTTKLNMLMLAVGVAVMPARAGNITGKVRAEGKPGTEPAASSAGNYASRTFKFVERVDYSEMHEFVVFIEGPVTNAPPAQLAPTVQVTTKKILQQKAVFDPHVLPVVAGTTVEWPNKDDIFHNVFSYSEAKPFDLGLYKDPEVKKVLFDKPGRVDVFCSIHSTMNCVVLVLDNPYFAVTNPKGTYAITNVPPGTYNLKAWHERLPPQLKQINVPASGDVQVDFVLGITGLPKY